MRFFVRHISGAKIMKTVYLSRRDEAERKRKIVRFRLTKTTQQNTQLSFYFSSNRPTIVTRNRLVIRTRSLYRKLQYARTRLLIYRRVRSRAVYGIVTTIPRTHTGTNQQHRNRVKRCLIIPHCATVQPLADRARNARAGCYDGSGYPVQRPVEYSSIEIFLPLLL